ncbi:MAG: hypothetical protein AAFR61_29940 [Bacteroidota bacterium]
MANQVRAITCPSCGGPTAAASTQCDYCGNFLLHLTSFEKRKIEDAPDKEGNLGHKIFRSLSSLYTVSLGLGLVMFVGIYLLFFNELSEDELVAISPIWFLLIVFGVSGRYTEKAVNRVLSHEAKDFGEGLSQAFKGQAPVLNVLIVIVFSLPYLFFGKSRWLSSPLVLSSLVTMVWAGGLYFFLVAIFPYA